MSLQTWKKEFYQIPAKNVSLVNALDHAIRKWTGLLYKNRRKHGLVRTYEIIYCQNELDEFAVDSTTCALCWHYLNKFSSCSGCPLYKELGNMPCDMGAKSPYMAFVERGSATAMLKALQRCKKKS